MLRTAHASGKTQENATSHGTHKKPDQNTLLRHLILLELLFPGGSRPCRCFALGRASLPLGRGLRLDRPLARFFGRLLCLSGSLPLLICQSLRLLAGSHTDPVVGPDRALTFRAT